MTRKIFSALLTLCAVLLFGVTAAAQLRCLARTADAVELHQPVGGAAFPVSMLTQLQDEMLVSGGSARTEQVWTESGNIESTSILYTDRYYPSIYPLNMKYGGFWATEGVVISDRLARKLFFSEDCVGAELQLNNGRFTITGVYAAGSDFLAQAAPSPDLFLPLDSADAVEMVTFPGSDPESYYLSVIPSGARARLSGWTALRLSPERNLLLLLDQWLLLAGWIIFTGFLFSWLSRKFKRCKKELDAELQQSYWQRALWQKRRFWLPMALAFLFWIALTIFAAKAILTQLPLPTNAVIENVFSLNDWREFLAARINFSAGLANPTMGTAALRICWTAVLSLNGTLGTGLLLAVAKCMANG